MASENPSSSTSEEEEMQLSLNQSTGPEEGSSHSVPRKRKKMNRYQGFGLDETVCLKKYETWESQARQIVNKTYEKLVKDLSREDEIYYLKNRLSTLIEKTSLDPIRIGCFGRTGAGKTSLLNAILGKKFFLPVSGESSCTSCVIQVKTSRTGQYEGTINLLSDDDWKEELKNLVEILERNGNDEDDENDDECVNDAIQKLRALYGVGAEERDYETLLKTRLQVPIPANRKISIKAPTADELSRRLDPYLRVGTEGTNKLWPLISSAEVTIPESDMPPEGIILLDVPGTGDFNKKRDEMWKQCINTCSVIWIISDIERVQGERSQPELLKESIKAFPGGVCTDIALVVTKSDKMNLEEYKRERTKNFPLENKHDAILERNRVVKDKKEKLIKEKLQKKLPPDSEILNKHKLVYTASAQEFWDKKHLKEEETEIPELRNYIRKLYLKENKKLVTDYVTDVLSILNLAKNLGSVSQLQVLQTNTMKELMMKELDSLEKHLEKSFANIEQPLCAGVDVAKKKYKKIVENLLTGYRGYHRTLKAVCLRDGVYASKNFARIDFNDSLAEPIYDKIDCIFENIFRTQNAIRSRLWSQLEMFKNEVQSQIRQTGKDNNLPNDKLEIFIQETNVILQQLEKKILKWKLDIYPSLNLFIQSELKLHYEAASNVRGRGSYERMKRILTEGIENEVENQMFEKAKTEMKNQFQKLKKDILLYLKEQMFMAFNLVFLQQEGGPVHLADIENERRRIEKIYNKLQNDN